MKTPSGYEKWLRDNTLDYRGYQITPGGIRRDGDCVVLTCHPLQTPRNVIFEDGKRIIDKRIEKETEDES